MDLALYKRARLSADDHADPDAVTIGDSDKAPVWFRQHDDRHHHDLIEMWRERRLCDGVIVVEGREFHVHRAVVAIGSKFLARAFESPPRRT